MNYSVYKHTFPNGKVYIGITSQKPEYRWGSDGKKYLGKSNNGEYHQPPMAKAILKYGWNNIEHKILFNNLTKEEAEQKEVELIAKYQSNNKKFGYNVTNGGDISCGHSEETKKKISESLKGEKNHFYGKHHSEEAKKKMSESKKGQPAWNKGVPMSNEQRKKISESKKGQPSPLKGIPMSEEAKQNMSNAQKKRLENPENHPMYGEHHSEETKRKISEAHKGKKLSEEHKKKLSQINKGRKGKIHTEESKEKMRNSKCKSVRCIETNIIYRSSRQAERDTGIFQTGIGRVCRGKQKTAGGYHWEFVK